MVYLSEACCTGSFGVSPMQVWTTIRGREVKNGMSLLRDRCGLTHPESNVLRRTS